MSEDVYAKPDLTKKVRFQGGEKEERTVDIYDNADSLRIYDNQWVEESTPPKLQDTTEGQHQITPVTVSSEKRNPFRAAAVFLGLLCLLLLAGIIGVGVQFIQDKTSWNEERNQLRVDNANLTSEKDQLQTSYNNLTSERDQLQTSNNNLTSERDQLQTSNNNLTSERDQLQTSNNNLTSERDQLRTSNNNLTSERDQLRTSNNNLTSERDQLRTSNNNLTSERDQLQTSNNNLTSERDQLQTSNNNLTSERDQLQTSYNNLTNERDQLQTSNNNLTNERDQLQTSNNNLTQKMNQLKNEEEQLRATNYNLTKERDELQKQLIEKACCPDNWQKFGYSCYFISTQKKNWKDSRIDCENKGALLVIISSREEQTFIASLNKRAWIGLTDEEREGTWKWVDGTPLTTGYWYNNQPDNMGPPWEKEEDCVET
uniref:uncharacterized protein n=1 Tax=Centroberyx gerrardi TaxID=166262 RepID=UPI003AAEFBB4